MHKFSGNGFREVIHQRALAWQWKKARLDFAREMNGIYLQEQKQAMRLTKKLEKEVLKVYNTGWEAYMRGDLKTHAACLSRDFKIIGTTEAEHFNTKKAWLAFCKKTIHQVVGVAQMRNRKIKLVVVGDGVMVEENSVIYVLMDGTWQFYSKLRVTALMQKEKSGWKYVHQHGSLPDTRASENEKIATEKIKKENQQLREAVKRRTIELEEKNRELEIEASLEKVRAQALGMRKSEDLLAICRTLYKELAALGFDTLRNAVIHVFHDERACFTDHEYSDSTGGNITPVPFKGDVIVEKFIKRIRKSENAFVELKVEGKELSNFKSFRKKTGQIKDNRLKQTKAIHYYIYSVGHASIGISSFNAIEKDKKELLKRFRNVFDFAYRRYHDIAQAQAQARESQIQLALERVRARTMAMHQSEELREVIELVYEQLVLLELPVEHVGFILDYRESKDMHIWFASKQVKPSEINIPYFDSPHWNSFLEAKAKGKNFFSNVLDFKVKNRFYKELLKWIPPLPDEAINAIFSRPGLIISTVLLENVGLYIENYSQTPFTEEENAILMRFGKVFQQTYTRFLDLQKAEDQAREAQIEAALERLRSKTMAMHRSEDLLSTVSLLFDQFRLLQKGNIYEDIDRSALALVNETEKRFDLWITQEGGTESNQKYHIDFSEETHGIALYQSFKQKNSHIVIDNTGEKLSQWLDYLKSTGMKISSGLYKKRRINTSIRFSNGFIIITSEEPLTDQNILLLNRFTKVFEQTYTRFLDLQNAEAQARAAQIEASLEKVRAKAMAMHSSEDLSITVDTFFSELNTLNVTPHRCGVTLIDEESRMADLTFTTTTQGNQTKKVTGKLKLEGHFILDGVYEHWKLQQEFHPVLRGAEIKKYYQVMNPQIAFPDYSNDQVQHGYYFFFKEGGVYAWTDRKLANDTLKIFRKFTSVLSLTYRRYIDLIEAEAQAREAQIEAALERVRAQAMAMHNSDDVGKCVIKMFSELTALGVDEGTRFGIGILNHENENNQLWTARKNRDEVNLHIGNIDMASHPLLKNARQAWLKQVPFHKYVLEGEDLLNYYQMLNNAPDYKIQIPLEQLPEREIQHCFIFEHGFFYAFCPREFQPELIHITKRFTSQFAQTYTRYLDLVRAEAQAREAQIEAALEKVRSRSLAMHTSSELNEVVKVLFEKLTELQVPSTAVGIQTFIEGSNDMQAFVCGDVGTGIVINQYRLPYFDHPIVHDYLHAHKNKLEAFVGNYSKKEKDSFYDVIVKLPELNDLTTEVKTMIYNSDFYEVTIVPAEKSLIVVNDFQGNPLAENQINILKRFAKVFDQAYTRFLDLQKAEVQAREAKIEAALERVRAQAMAMHHTDDLKKTIEVYFEQLDDLIDSAIVRCGAGLLNKENTIAEMSTASKSQEGETYSVKGRIDMRGHPLLESTYEHWLEQKEYHHVLRGNEIREYYQYITGQVAIPENRGEDELHFYFPMFTEGSFYVVTSTEVPENELQIFRRFSSVLSLTYRRFNDLQKAEAQAKEAVKQSSLDRIRGEIASMRTPQDLDRITPLIWKELTTLNIPFIRCGVFIMDDALQQIHTFLSTPDGKAIAAFHLPYEAPGRTREILTSWNNKQAYIEHWDETAFSELGDLLVQQGALPSKDVYLKTVPGGGLYLHCLPFMQGMLYVGNTVKLNEVEIQLIQSVADAFSTAYARYEDFNKLEAAKATVEKTLTDLKQTQAQLVQSEKMASLGELTAGIAHEIQNPLNFVNNFSEVSHELLDEMKEEIDKGNYEEVKAISRDVKQNLEKILHHGKRADGIVKGMLQHSRSSSGTKEPTDINALADEYLRLAYHGLRAKDKSFNAKFETNFDESIGKIEVVPQDMGRVILNLITNAFYVVAEKKKQNPEGYEPTVIVSSRKVDGKVELSVRDNGLGVPNSIKDKIFQPFFTTKPTGQGTGLGLSLSYDIVKSHGGELKVETTEGRGTTFTITLYS